MRRCASGWRCSGRSSWGIEASGVGNRSDVTACASLTLISVNPWCLEQLGPPLKMAQTAAGQAPVGLTRQWRR